MKIQKIIVDEIPEKCYFCDLCVDLADGDGYRCIGITNSDAQDNRLGYSIAALPFRRHDCPLLDLTSSFPGEIMLPIKKFARGGLIAREDRGGTL